MIRGAIPNYPGNSAPKFHILTEMNSACNKSHQQLKICLELIPSIFYLLKKVSATQETMENMELIKKRQTCILIYKIVSPIACNPPCILFKFQEP